MPVPLLGVLGQREVVPEEGRVREPSLEGHRLVKIRAHHEVLRVDHLGVPVDELVCEVLAVVVQVLEVILREGQHRVLPDFRWSAPTSTTHDVPDREGTRGHREIPHSGHDPFEDLDFVSGLVLVLILKTSMPRQCLMGICETISATIEVLERVSATIKVLETISATIKVLETISATIEVMKIISATIEAL